MRKKKTQKEENAALGKAMKERMAKRRMSAKALAKRWKYPESYVEFIIEKGLPPMDIQIKEICKILNMRKRWKGWDVV